MRMIERRDNLIARIKGVIDDPDFNYADRLRRETFDSSTRHQRLRIMGDPVKYCEVLHAGTGDIEQEDSLGMNVLDSDIFRVNLWMEYRDHDDYQSSSQYDFDRIVYGDDGIIRTLDSEPGAVYPGFIWSIANVESLVVSLDEEGKELAHFLTFTITMR
jgi:hypothetical protein